MRALLRIICLAMAVGFSSASHAADSPPDRVDEYSFTLDGERFVPRSFSLSARGGLPREGDFIDVRRVRLRLGTIRRCELISTPREDGRLLLRLPDGSERVVGVTIDRTYGDPSRPINPLSKLSPEEIRGLWGVCIRYWPDGIEEQLMQLDLSRVCITITASTAVGTPKALPAIPKRVQYLNISEYSNDGITDLSALKEFSSLRGLWLDLRTVEQLDLDLLAPQKDLRLLEIHCRRLTGIESLASLKQLRSLDLRWSKGVSDVRFARELVRLRWLNLDRTDVRDLSPAGALRSLVWLSANSSNVSKLPTGPLPSLRTLSLFSTPVSDEEVNAFAASHPNCKVLHRWTEAFRDSVAKVDRIRVRSGGTCHRRIDQEKTLLEIQGTAVRDFIAKIEIDESRSGFHCMCCGSPTFEFYEGKRLVAMVGFHHGRSVRWLYGWPGDGLLTPKSANALVNWLADKGVTEPLKERQEALRQRSGNQ